MDEPRYTAREWAIIEGGHELEPAKKELSFIQGLYEEGLVEKKSDKKDDDEKETVIPTKVKNYRFIVSNDRLPFIAKFLNSAKEGKTVIANFVQAYLPIIEMVDDIVRAGPTYVHQLKILHNRAKRDLKK